MKDYLERLDEKCHKFSKKYNIPFEEVQSLMQWVEWISGQKTVEKIINDLKKYA